jgi:hypothetical protein
MTFPMLASKDPDGIKDYVIDWSDWLDGDTLATSLWFIHIDSGRVQTSTPTVTTLAETAPDFDLAGYYLHWEGENQIITVWAPTTKKANHGGFTGTPQEGDRYIVHDLDGKSGLLIDSDTNNTTQGIVWLNGGLTGSTYILTNRITTTAGRGDDRSFTIEVKER